MSRNSDESWSRAIETWRLAAREVSTLEDRIDPAAFAACVDLLAEYAGRAIVSGVGTSAAAARKIAHTLSCVERPAFFLSPADAVHGALGSVQSGDVAILISKGGNTRELLNLIPALSRKGVPVIAVTENADSVLAKECRILLRVSVEREADAFNMLATTSTLAVVAVFDAISVAVSERTGFTREQFGVIHPGGAVGERLLEENQ